MALPLLLHFYVIRRACCLQGSHFAEDIAGLPGVARALAERLAKHAVFARPSKEGGRSRFRLFT